MASEMAAKQHDLKERAAAGESAAARCVCECPWLRLVFCVGRQVCNPGNAIEWTSFRLLEAPILAWRDFQGLLAVARSLPECQEYRRVITESPWDDEALEEILAVLLPKKYPFLYNDRFFFGKRLEVALTKMRVGEKTILWTAGEVRKLEKLLRRVDLGRVDPDSLRAWAELLRKSFFDVISVIRHDEGLRYHFELERITADVKKEKVESNNSIGCEQCDRYGDENDDRTKHVECQGGSEEECVAGEKEKGSPELDKEDSCGLDKEKGDCREKTNINEGLVANKDINVQEEEKGQDSEKEGGEDIHEQEEEQSKNSDKEGDEDNRAQEEEKGKGSD